MTLNHGQVKPTLDLMAGLHRRKRRATTTDDYAKMLVRMLRAYENRATQDPAAGLALLSEIETAAAEIRNVAIYGANRDAGHSINELADMLGVSKQAVHQRVQAGEQILRLRARPQKIPRLRRALPRQLPPGSTGPA